LATSGLLALPACWRWLLERLLPQVHRVTPLHQLSGGDRRLQEKNLSAPKREKIRGIVQGYVDFRRWPTRARAQRQPQRLTKSEFIEEFKATPLGGVWQNVESYNNEKVDHRRRP
jgi:hypothetical protein